MPDIAEPSSDAAFAPSILLVEDEPGIVDFLRRGLEAEGFVVQAALNGLDGEQRARRESFDMVVLDLMLPGLGGMELLAKLRDVKPELPVIVLTARAGIEWLVWTPARSTTW
jgi:DNA-binding response OmpR family regulator